MSLDGDMPRLLHNISMHTQVSMREIADMAVFLASDLAPHISGQSISVCGNVESFRTTPLPARETVGPEMQGSESHTPGGSL